MSWRWDWYVPDVSVEELHGLILQWSDTVPHADDVVRRVLQIGTLCRLAFASLLDADGPSRTFNSRRPPLLLKPSTVCDETAPARPGGLSGWPLCCAKS